MQIYEGSLHSAEVGPASFDADRNSDAGYDCGHHEIMNSPVALNKVKHLVGRMLVNLN